MGSDNIQIVYEDAELLVVDKPAGLLSVPGLGPEKQECVVNRVKLLFPAMINQPAVHRIDMATSGLMLIAKTTSAHRNLSIQFAQRQVEKRYIALLEGVLRQTDGEIRLAFRLDPDHRPYQVYDPIQGKPGITRWRRIAVEKGRTRVDFTPLTGRTHQLRLHAAHPKGLGLPIVGDPLYGNGKEGERLHLHAFRLQFRHPQNGRTMAIVSEVPF